MATRTIASFTAGLVGNLDDTAQFAMADKNGATRRYTVAQLRPKFNDATARVADLLFTDATYDIGKSGATRPRDGFFSRHLTVGGDGTFHGTWTLKSRAGSGAPLIGDAATIADDSVASFSLPAETSGLLIVMVTRDSNIARTSKAFILRTGAGITTTHGGDGFGAVNININAGSTSTPTGTTGTDGVATVYVPSGAIYIENRLGASHKFSWWLFTTP